jgi:hypothetical protein
MTAVTMTRSAADYARFTLAGIRMFNGCAALFAPDKVAARLGADLDETPGLSYMMRMFGIRTILISAELVIPERRLRPWAVAVAPLVHVTDATAAATAGLKGQLPRRAAVMTTLISTTNAVLAVVAARGSGRR